jgi:predicted RNase H-like nuclease (RuvC/YqgF family)
MDNMQKIDYLTKRSSDLLAEMRRLEKDNQKNKRRGDSLQKERDGSRTELSKTVGLKEKLEKLCRELQRDNNKMKVSKYQSLPVPVSKHETDIEGAERDQRTSSRAKT